MQLALMCVLCHHSIQTLGRPRQWPLTTPCVWLLCRPRFSDLLPQLQELLQAVRWQAKQAQQAQQAVTPASSQPATDGSQSSAPRRCASIDTQASAASEGSTAPLLRAGSLPPLARAGSSPQPLCPECSAQQL